MYGGKIIKESRKTVEGTHKMYGYHDAWDESFDIEYDGEITPEVKTAIINAFRASPLHEKGGSSYGALRWPSADSNIRVEGRQLIVTRSMGLAD